MIFRYKIKFISDIEQKIRKLLVNIAVAPFVGVWIEIDEEITAVLEQYPDNFKMAKLKLLEHMMFKYGQDVDNSVGPVSFNFGNRMNFWKQLYDDLKKEIASSSVGIKPYENEKRKYFYIGMMNHPGGGRF